MYMPGVAAHGELVPSCFGFANSTRKLWCQPGGLCSWVLLCGEVSECIQEVDRATASQVTLANIDIPFVVAAPLIPRGVGRQRKLRIKASLKVVVANLRQKLLLTVQNNLVTTRRERNRWSEAKGSATDVESWIMVNPVTNVHWMEQGNRRESQERILQRSLPRQVQRKILRKLRRTQHWRTVIVEWLECEKEKALCN